ncbi:exocyst complex component EXO70B1-like [Neltuma alba]|uniref:exocyst complex component EXO70B1-like n=1 Tax=Neltuma alba TaxID=207710 RepID=UPI0010A4693C|nr:exocyst complex component EXO70B1-like [Prosopis alba]
MKIKSDVFSVVSSGSFTFTSLSLKMQNIQLGFEDDLLKFFLGFLTVQLMKINLLLTLIGAALCYLAIVLIPWSLDSPLETVSCTTALQENGAIKIDTPASDLRKQLCSTQLGIVNDKENPERLVYPSDFESKQKDAIASGLVEECYDAFVTWRKQFLNDKMTTTGFQNLSINEVHRLPMKTLKNDIQEWTKACHFVVKTLFPQERHACSVVFSALSLRDELSFMEVCRGITTQLLNYAKAVSTTTLSPERLFRIVDVLDTLEEILPDMESLFRNKICEFLHDEAIAASKRLGEAIKGSS